MGTSSLGMFKLLSVPSDTSYYRQNMVRKRTMFCAVNPVVRASLSLKGFIMR